MNDKTLSGNEKGMVLVTVLLLIAVSIILGTTAVMQTSTDLKISTNYKTGKEAFYNADAGVHYALSMMEAGLGASPATFSLPTSADPSDANNSSTLNYSVPSGFSFVISDITMLAPDIYSFTSTGSGPNNATAAVTATFTVTAGIFNYGIFGNLGVTMSGNGKTDSYDSSVGPYTWATHNTNGDVGTNDTGTGAIALSGNATIYGNAVVGQGGFPSTDVTTSGNAQVLGQKLAADEPKDMTPLTLPSGGTSMSAWNISGNNSDTLSSGTYRLPGININGNGKGYISGDVTLYVTGNIATSGNGKLQILPGGSLTIYVAGSMNISGNGIANDTTSPEKLQVYGTSTCTNVSISGNGNIYGAIYAPLAGISITGNGDIYGSIIGSTMNISGNGNIHYDEALQNVGPGNSDLKLLSWEQKI